MEEIPVTKHDLHDENNYPYVSGEEASSGVSLYKEEFDYVDDSPQDAPYLGADDPNNWDLD